MAHLIDKDTLIAEIERRISNHNKELQHANDEDFVSSWASNERNQKFALTALIPFINTLEVKEVDLEKEIAFQWEGCDCDDINLYAKVSSEQFKAIAKHFFELGLKSKKS